MENKELKKYVEALKKRGYTVISNKNNSHYKVLENGEVLTTIGKHSKNHRSVITSTERYLRRPATL